MTPRQIAYQEYLKSEHWALLRAKALHRDKNRCQECKTTKRLHVHHLKYRLRFEDSVLEDLKTLCFKCHEKEHGFEQKPFIKPKVKTGKPRIAKNAKQLKRWWEKGWIPDKEFEAQKSRLIAVGLWFKLTQFKFTRKNLPPISKPLPNYSVTEYEDGTVVAHLIS